MIALLFFVLSSSSLFLIFRGMGKDRNTVQVLMFNYFFCSCFSGISLWYEGGGFSAGLYSPWIFPSLLLGGLYLINFFLTERSVRNLGAAVSSVSTKLSLVLPFFYSLYIRNEMPGLVSILALFLSVSAILLCSWPGGSLEVRQMRSGIWLLPLLIFLGTGITDILTQWLNQSLVPANESAQMVFVVFSGAFVSAAAVVFYRQVSKQEKMQWSNAWPGFWLGLPNFISYKSILVALSAFHHQGNIVFPIANLGVIVFTSMVSLFYFKESMSGLNRLGIFLALLALLLFLQIG